MKKKSIVLLVVAFLSFLAIPFKASATTPVTIYFFRGDGCSFCAAAESFFESLAEDEEYKDLFVVKDFEVWNDEDNADFADEVASVMGDTLEGVPYIIIGDESWNGYTETYNDAIKAKIKEVAEDDDFVDPLAEMVANYEANIPEEENNSLVSIAILIGVVVVIGAGLYFARRGVESEDKLEEKENKKEIVKEKKETKTLEEPQENTKKGTVKPAEEKKEEKVSEKTTEQPKKTAKKNTSKSTNTKKNTTTKTTSKKSTNSKKTTTKKTTK